MASLPYRTIDCILSYAMTDTAVADSATGGAAGWRKIREETLAIGRAVAQFTCFGIFVVFLAASCTGNQGGITTPARPRRRSARTTTRPGTCA